MENKYKGWIEGFGSVIDNQLGVGTKKKVLDQCKSCQQISSDREMAQCVKEVMLKFDQIVTDKEKRYGVMETMGNTCFNNFFVKIAEAVKKKSNNITEIIQNLNNLAGEEHFKLGDKKVYATFNKCLCQIGVKEVIESISKTYCSCSLGWMKNLYKTLLDKSVKVELLEKLHDGVVESQKSDTKIFRNDSPAFNITYPDYFIDLNPSPISKAIFTASHADINLEINVSTISPKRRLEELTKKIVRSLKIITKEIEIISDKPTNLRDGTPAYETIFEYKVVGVFKTKSMHLSVFKDGKWIRVSISAAANNLTEKLKEILYSLEFK